MCTLNSDDKLRITNAMQSSLYEAGLRERDDVDRQTAKDYRATLDKLMHLHLLLIVIGWKLLIQFSHKNRIN